MKKITLLCLTMLFSCFGFAQVSIGNSSGGSGSISSPITNYWGYSYGQSIYLASEVNASGDITSLDFKLNPGASFAEADENVDVWIGTTTKTNFENDTDWVDVSTLTQVLTDGTLTISDDLLHIEFSAPFNYNGTDNLIIAVDANEGDYGGSSDYVLQTEAQNGDNLSLLYRNDNTATDPLDPDAASVVQSLRGNIVINGITQTCLPPTDLTATNITTSSVDISWTDTADEWEIIYGPSGFDFENEGTIIDDDDGTLGENISGLDSGTTYQAYVRSICSTDEESSLAGPVDFVTVCTGVDNFTENFDSSVDFPNCWSKLINSTSEFSSIAISSFGSFSEPNAVQMNNSGDAAAQLYLITPELNTLPNADHRIRFYAHTSSASSLEVGTMTDPTDASTYTSIQTIDATSDYEEYSVNFDAVTTDQYVAFKATYTATYYNVYIDNVSWEPIPSCMKPSDFSFDEATTTTADLSWTAGESETQWEVKYGEPGFDPMTEGTAVTVDDSPNTTLTGLIADTEYEAYVKSICDTNDESIYTLPITFSTRCEATTVPFTQDFEEVTAPDVPNCGTLENLSEGNNWETYNQGSNGFDSNVLRYKYASGPADAWYYTQGITLDAGTDYQISYKYGNNSTTYTEKLKVSYGTSPVAADMTTELANHSDISSATAQTDVLSFSVTTSGVYYFGFNAYSGSNQFYLYVDDIEVIVSPSCATPTNVVANNISEASAEISWTENGAATEWEIVYGEPDFDPTTDGTSITDSDDLGEILTDLDAETEYDVYVRAICGTDGESAFSDVMTFTTLPVPPANDDLCDAMVLTVDEACAGGTTYTNTGATAQTDEPEGSCWYSATNGKTVWFNFEAPVGGNVTVTTDIAGATLTDTHIAIYEAATDCADLSTLGTEVGCDEDGGDIVGSGYTSVATMTGLTAGETYYVQVSGYGGSEGDFCIEVNDDGINCLAPTDITFANTNDTSTEVTWTENGSATEWEIIYGATGFEPMTGDESTTISDNDGTLGETLSGLTPEAGYDVYVRALCDDGESVLAGPASFTTEAAPCEIPTDITFDNVDDTSADISWTENGDATEWEIVYGTPGFDPMAEDEGTTVLDNDGTLGETLSDLTPGQDYDVYVRALCDEDNSSDFSEVGTLTTLSIDSQRFEDFTYYPNPVQNELNLKASTTIGQVLVYNLLGQEVISKKPQDVQTKLDLSSLQTGVYLMKVSLNGSEQVFRLIKE